jgi:hypothetical protein
VPLVRVATERKDTRLVTGMREEDRTDGRTDGSKNGKNKKSMVVGVRRGVGETGARLQGSHDAFNNRPSCPPALSSPLPQIRGEVRGANLGS